MVNNTKRLFSVIGSSGRPPSSVLCLLFSIGMVLAALWSVQVMSSAFLRVAGDEAQDQKNYQRAATLYRAASAVDPQNWRAHLGLGQVCQHNRYYELDKALKREWAEKERAAYALAYRYDTKRSKVTYGLGRVELALGNQERGLALLDEAAQLSRFNDYYWRKLGIELRKAERYEDALAAFAHAMPLDRSNKTVKKNIEWLKRMMKDEQ